MRFSRASLIGLVVGAMIFLGIVIVPALDDGSGEDVPQSSVISTSLAATSPTAGPEHSQTQAPPTTASPLTFTAEDGFALQELEEDAESGQNIGLLLVDIETNEREFWSNELQGRPGDDYYARYSADVTHRWLQLRSERTGSHESKVLIADRTTGESYRLDNEWVLVAGPTAEGLLVSQSRADPNTFVLIDLASDPLTVTHRFPLPLAPIDSSPIVSSSLSTARQALLLGDGETLLIVVAMEGRLEPGKTSPPRLFALNIRTGEVTRWPHVEARGLLLRGMPNGGARLLAWGNEWTSYEVSANGEPVGQMQVHVGERTLERAGYYNISPDGRWLTWQEQLPLQIQGGVGDPWHWPVVYLADLETGEVVLRILRADPVVWLGDRESVSAVGSASEVGAIVWQQWRFQGESGFLLKTPAGDNCPEECVYHVTAAPGELALLRPDCSLEAIPMIPDGTFAAALRDLPPGNLGLSSDGRELRVEGQARGGRDFGGGVSNLPLPAHVQQPPFADAVLLHVSAGGDALNLRTAPGVASSILGKLSDGAPVVVTDGDCSGFGWEVCSVVYAPDDTGEDVAWLHVQGQELTGWVSAELLTWADDYDSLCLALRDC